MPRSTLIQNVSVVDVEHGVTRAGVVAIRSARFDDPRRGGFDEVLDGAGMYACPGLIDCHTHLFLDAGPDPRRTFLASTDRQKRDTAAVNAVTALRAGITTLRDCGAPAQLVFDLKASIDSGHIPGPRILTCGSPLTRPAGHCHFLGIEVSRPEEVRRAVEDQVALGASFIKLMTSGGGLTPGTRPAEADLPEELIRTAVQAAHVHGVYTTAHCHASESIVRCVRAGVEIVEHASFLGADGTPLFDPAMAQRMRDTGTIVSPTVISGTRIADLIRRNRHRNSDDAGAIQRLEARRRHIGRFMEAGVRIIAGTDCGVPGTTFDSLVDELAAYVGAGMNSADALRSATSQSARYLRRPDLGQIEPGKCADLLLLQRNPLETVDALRNPAVVIKAGEIVCDSRCLPAR